MRPAYAGPGSQRWKPTQDPGKKAASASLGGNRAAGADANAASKGGSGQQSNENKH